MQYVPVNLCACMGDTYIAVDLIDMEAVHQLWGDGHWQKSSSAVVVLLLIAHLQRKINHHWSI